jgi:hypothetical protein
LDPSRILFETSNIIKASTHGNVRQWARDARTGGAIKADFRRRIERSFQAKSSLALDPWDTKDPWGFSWGLVDGIKSVMSFPEGKPARAIHESARRALYNIFGGGSRHLNFDAAGDLAIASADAHDSRQATRTVSRNPSSISTC